MTTNIKKSIPKVLLLIGIFIAFIIGMVYIYTNWRGHKILEESHAIRHAESVVTFLNPTLVSTLADGSGDSFASIYDELKVDLMRFKNQNAEIEFAYLFMLKDEKLFFLVDSEPPESDDYSPHGQEYYEATAQDMLPFSTGKALLTNPATDRWGTWVSALVPIRDKTSGEVIAVFGVDYPAETWNAEINQHVISSVIMVVCILLMLGGIYRLYDSVLKKRVTTDILRESERNKEVLLSHIPGIAYRCAYDDKWTMLYLSAGCYTLTGYHPQELLNNNKLAFSDIICEEYQEILQNEWARIIETKSDFKYEYEITTATGAKKWVIEMGQPVFNDNGEVEALEGIIIDITEPKQATEKILYMADHDYLTGVFSRKYFEEAKQKLGNQGVVPAAVILADINGMRLINDAFGQAEGDVLITKTAELIKRCCGEECILARTGGDEFSVLVPYADAAAADRLIRRIEEECDYCNALNLKPGVILNLSLGYGIRQTAEQTFDAVRHEAEEFLNRHKILERKSHHNTILSSIMATMYARSYETEEHAERLTKLSGIIGRKMNLNEKSLMDLELLSILHDIGKMGIDDRILNKPGALTDEEWAAMKKHPEIGYRIAMSAPEFEGVAEYILCHHERWDGKGYPQGLKGEEVPLLSRIIAIADAYDAMTEDRVYRKGMTHEKALEEIRQNAGTQFDPYIAELFLASV